MSEWSDSGDSDRPHENDPANRLEHRPSTFDIADEEAYFDETHRQGCGMGQHDCEPDNMPEPDQPELAPSEGQGFRGHEGAGH
jgi:hypothetical protein